MFTITLNDKVCEVGEGTTLIAAAAANDVYVPSLCHHPDLPPFHELPFAPGVFRGDVEYVDGSATSSGTAPEQGCGLCVVAVDGWSEPVRACRTQVTAGMVVRTESETLKVLRRRSLSKILARHPHACLTCAQRGGCSLEDCSSNVPKDERCCSQFHNCELRRVADYVGIREDTPRYRPVVVPPLPREPLVARNFSLCIDCARCVRICNHVRGVEALGIVQNQDRLVVGSIAPTLVESGCKFCGACVEVCPTGCLTDADAAKGDRESRLVPCVHKCPAGVDVPGYIRRIAQGDFKGAAALVWEKLPLANMLGHICFHLCEYECRRGRIDEPIAICALKRFALEAGDGAFVEDIVQPKESGKKVAVVGAGPAGLAAAYYLRFKGHAVTILDAADEPGGMPSRAVPAYRLPKDVLERDLAVIRKLGVEIETGHAFDDDEAMRDLRNVGFDAVLIAVGLPESKRIELQGSDLEGVFWGLEFLTDAKAGGQPNLGENVVVVGGGNVAIDVAMTAQRLSGGRVRLFCLERRAEMPAHAHEIEKAEEEGVQINDGWGPALIHDEDGRVTSVEFRRCVAVFDEKRRFAPRFDDELRQTVEADSVILAIGQQAPDGLPREAGGVFLAGDILGPAGGGSAVQAVASGRSAAERIDRHLGGDGVISPRLTDHDRPNDWIGRDESFAPCPRVPLPVAPADERRMDFREIEGTYAPESAVAEAKRCLQCDLRLLISAPVLPPERWLAFTAENVELVPMIEGAFMLAGADKKPTMIKGTADIRGGLQELLASGRDASFFLWEEDRMYTKRESELIQQHLQQYGELPGGGDDELDNLF